jgi:hypothetical protein
MKHLKDRSLIDYQFKLLEAELAAEVARHLASCEQCRQRAGQLAKRLSALDLMKDDPAVSEDLVTQTLAKAESGPIRTPPFRIWPWLAAAAALILVAATVAFWLPSLRSRPQSMGSIQRATKSLALDSPAQPPQAAPTLGLSDRATEVGQAPAGMRQELAAGGMRPSAVALHLTDSQQPETSNQEPPPFAPASAIELVTLPKRDSVQLTIYNSADLTLVRDRRSLTLKKGWNWLQFMWANTLIDPTSLDLEPKDLADQIEVSQLVYPARLKDLGRWLIHSNVDGKAAFEITYFTSGISWRAFYSGTMTADERAARLEGYVRVTNNSGEDYDNARVRLVVGQVHLLDQVAELARREYPYDRPAAESLGEESLARGVRRRVENAWEEKDKKDSFDLGVVANRLQKVIEKEGLSEYFLYTVEGTETIPHGWSKRMISFTADQVPVANLCKYEEERYGRSVVRFLSLRNDKEHRLGITPIPDGNLEVCRSVDDTGHLAYVGTAGFKYIPVGQEVELNLGHARDVLVEPKCMDFKMDSLRFDSKGNLSGWDEVRTWRISVRNAREIPVKAEIKRNFRTGYWQLTRSDAIGAYEQVDKDTVKFTLDLAPRSSQTFEYQLRTYHGTREQDWRQ